MQLPFLKNLTRDDLLALTADELQALIDAETPEVPRIKCYQCTGAACANAASINAVLCDEGVTACMNHTTYHNATDKTVVDFMLGCATWDNLKTWSLLPGKALSTQLRYTFHSNMGPKRKYLHREK